jgi:hypothetical protein
MNDTEIVLNVKQALNNLVTYDPYLIQNDLSEQCITHKLAEHLQKYLSEYNVDCEYNRSVDEEYGKKKIKIIKEKLQDKGLLREGEKLDVEKEYTERAVFPDIIVHKRPTSDFNLCIIELKKSTSSVNDNYDQIKLEAYTSNVIGNNLKYQLGIFIKIYIDKLNPTYQIEAYYKNGTRIDLE